ncbi:MAG: hypothetical protein ACK5NL_04565 [Vibrio fluvialis]
MNKVSQIEIRLNRSLWLTLIFAVIVSRVAFYSFGLWGVEMFAKNQDSELSAWQTICRFDCVWYARIIQYGYDLAPQWLNQQNAANWAFMPLQPLLGWVLSRFPFFSDSTENVRLGLVLVSNLSFFTSVVLTVMLLKQLKFGERLQYAVIWLLCFSPYTVYSMAGYTEPLFLSLVTATFLFSYRQQWFWVAVCGLLAAVTRNLGVFLVFPILLIAIQREGFEAIYRFKEQGAKAIAAIWVLPFGFFCYMTYLYFHMGDALAFGHIQIAWGRQLTNPVKWIVHGFTTRGTKLYLAIVSILGLALNLYLLYRKKYAEASFMLIGLLLPLSSSLNAMPRYLFGLSPTFLGIVLLFERYPFIQTPLLCLFSAAGTFISVSFFSHLFFTV